MSKLASELPNIDYVENNDIINEGAWSLWSFARDIDAPDVVTEWLFNNSKLALSVSYNAMRSYAAKSQEA